MSDGLQTTWFEGALDPLPGKSESWPSFDTQLVLASPRLGLEVLERLRAIGIMSLADLRATGVDAAVERVCRTVGSKAWRNRRKALHSAVSAYEMTCGIDTLIANRRQ